jgi:hypothetical protein
MRLVSSLLLLAAVGCGVDSAQANGELGRMTFTMVSDYYLDDHDITQNAIVTGHEQTFGVDLTGMGASDAGKRADEIEYVMVPDDGVTIEQVGPEGDSGDDDSDAEVAHGFSLTVEDPGDYQLEARLSGETFDRIHLSFDTPAALSLSLFVRDPWEEQFNAVRGTDTQNVEVGSQLAWLPIPVDGEGNRLLGTLEADLSADPQEAVVPAANVEHVNEDEVETFFGAPSLYFVDEGDVTVTLTDTASPAVGTAAFTVGPMAL